MNMILTHQLFLFTVLEMFNNLSSLIGDTPFTLYDNMLYVSFIAYN